MMVDIYTKILELQEDYLNSVSDEKFMSDYLDVEMIMAIHQKK